MNISGKCGAEFLKGMSVQVACLARRNAKRMTNISHSRAMPVPPDKEILFTSGQVRDNSAQHLP